MFFIASRFVDKILKEIVREKTPSSNGSRALSSALSVEDFVTFIDTKFIRPIPKQLIKGQLLEIKKFPSVTYAKLRDEFAQTSIDVFWFVNNNTAHLNRFEGGELIIIEGFVKYITGKQANIKIKVLNILNIGDGQIKQKRDDIKRKLIEENEIKLNANGVYEPTKFFPLPKFPKKVCVITSQSSIARDDIYNNVMKRWPIANIDFEYIKSVDGSDARESGLLHKLDTLYRNDSIDIIVIARGGGDKQGMYMYDDEHLIQKILKRTKCVVSAVGHDEDHPILEYVVDRVCSTPTAVSYIFPDLQAEKEKIKNYCSFLQRKTSEVYNFHKTRLTTLQNKFNTIFNELYTDAKDKLRETEKSIDKYVKLIDNKRLELKHFIPDIKTKILSLIDSKYSQYKNLRDDLVRKNVASIDKRISSLKTLQEDLLRRISSNIDKRVSYLKTLQDDFIRKGKNVLDEKERKIIKLQSEFNVASPEQILENGYAIISKNNKILSSFGSVSPNDTLTIKTKDNIITVVVRDVKDKQ